MNNRPDSERYMGSLNIQQNHQHQDDGRPNGPCGWVIRIISILIFAATLFINFFIGRNTGGISNDYRLWVTPQGFFFQIWIVIYVLLAIVNVVNLIRNTWSIRTHVIYAVSNLLNIGWIIAFGQGNDPGVFTSSLIIILLAISI